MRQQVVAKDEVRFIRRRKTDADKAIGETPSIEFERMKVSATVNAKFILK